MSSNNSNSSLALIPLGAGDLIDRAVRFYKQNFWTFVWIAAPPILFGTFISIGWTILERELFSTGANKKAADEVFSILFTVLGTIIIFLFEIVAMLVVMGGASRNFVRHLLFGETVTFRETYSNVKTRLGGLIVASLAIVFILGFIGFIFFWVAVALALIVIGIVALIFSFFEPLAQILSIIVFAAVMFGTGWIFFLLASRFAYVPQIMLVEGQSVSAAMGRSTSLASGNVTRIYALFIFTFVAIFAAMWLLYVPLGWYAFANGIEFFGNDIDAIPAWYIIANQLVTQISLILLAPILMIGLCLLYVDERVRSEGYDIELMAARNLGEIPAVPTEYANPLQPALAAKTLMSMDSESLQKSTSTTLGLE
ncbi:MAG: hypothetical protein AAB336_11800 [Acidobacteriota bacterium]